MIMMIITSSTLILNIPLFILNKYCCTSMKQVYPPFSTTLFTSHPVGVIQLSLQDIQIWVSLQPLEFRSTMSARMHGIT